MIVGAGFKPARNRNNDQTENSVDNIVSYSIIKINISIPQTTNGAGFISVYSPSLIFGRLVNRLKIGSQMLPTASNFFRLASLSLFLYGMVFQYNMTMNNETPVNNFSTHLIWILLLIPIALSKATMMSDITAIFMNSLLSIVVLVVKLLINVAISFEDC
jgi:hypothetical protein